MKANEINLSTSSALANEAVKLLIEKKAIGIRMFSVEGNSTITDYYINATGRSQTHVVALADEIAEKLSELGRDSLRIEGRQGKSWLLIDYGDVIINVFDGPSREFYNFDRLMPDNSEADISSLVEEVDAKMNIKSEED